MRAFVLVAATALTTAACGDMPTENTLDLPLAEASAAATGPKAAALYEISITNLTGGQPFTPPLAVIHRASSSLFRVGAAASFGVKEIAENGNLPPLFGTVTADKHTADAVIAAGPPPGAPLVPGETRAFNLAGDRGANLLSFVSMLICTNDGFTGLDSARLPRDVGQTETWHAAAYDAGTEVNTEAWEDLVPPCGPLTGFDSGGAGTGMSDPTLAENGVIHHHGGIAGGGDLTPAVHDWSNPVARIVVTRIG